MPIKNNQGSDNIPQLRFPEFEGEWKVEIFDNILEITRLAGYEYSTYWEEDKNKEIIALRGYNIGKGKLELNNLGYISKELSLKLSRSKLYKGDIVYPCVGTIGNAVVIEEDDKYHIQQNIAKLTPKEEISPYFIAQFLMSDLGLNEVYKFNATSSQPNVLVGSLRNFKIVIPKYSEQTKIASFLTAVDEKIQALKKKHSLLEQYKKGVMQKLFSQETEERGSRTPLKNNKKGEQLRFKDEKGNDFPEWEVKKLGEVCNEHQLKNKNKETDEVFSVAKHKGVINQIEHLGRSFSAKEILHYKLIYPGDLVYTKSPTADFPFGIIKQNRTGRIGVVSPLYCVFKPSSFALGYILHEYFNSAINTLNYLSPLVQKGAKNTMNINNDTFLNGAGLLLPMDEKEQTKIANFLSALDEKINQIQTQVEKTENWKKGLLQKMFC